jgi:hypothetical protein
MRVMRRLKKSEAVVDKRRVVNTIMNPDKTKNTSTTAAPA